MTNSLVPGDQFTWLQSGISYLTTTELSGGEQVSIRGQVVTLTEDLRQANADRTGSCWLDLITDAEAQETRWGRQIFAPGALSVASWEPNTLEHEWARDEARRIANAEPDPAERAAKLRQVEVTFGKIGNPSGQRSSWSPGDLERDSLLRAEGRR